jgi:hypothetical protein
MASTMKTVAQQIEMLRLAAAPRLLSRVEAIVLLLASVALAFDFGVRFLGLGIFLGVLFLAMAIGRRQAMPNRLKALRGLEAGSKVAGMVEIDILPSDDWKYYRATTTDRDGVRWVFPFEPSEWQPEEGNGPADLYFIAGTDWPVVAVTESGILVPGARPKRVRAGMNPLWRWVLALACLGVSGWLMVGGWRAYLDHRNHPPTLVATDAVVVAKDFLRAEPGQSHGLKYLFTLPDGRRIEGQWSDADTHWKAYRLGDRIRIQYLADAPGRNAPEGRLQVSPDLPMTILLTLFGLPFLVAGGYLLIGLIRRP